MRLINQRIAIVLLLCLVSAFSPAELFARVRLENICSIYGQQEKKLVGMGLVVGLKGTGDGGKYFPTIRALAQAMKLNGTPVEAATELKDASNVALVLVEASIPASGIRRGQKVDCYVNSIGAAKSLRGGRLMTSFLGGESATDDIARGVASGAVFIEDAQTPTSGKIPAGVMITEDVVNLFIENNRFKLLLDKDHASFQSATEIARVVNGESRYVANGQTIAKATGPGVVEVTVPEQYVRDPIQFVADVLDVAVENPHTQARVVVNAKAGTVIVSGEVEISPVVINHKNMTVTIGASLTEEPPPGTTGEPKLGEGFVALLDQQSRQSPQKLETLVKALNQLKVPNADVIEIIKDLHRSGKLHAVLIME